MRIDWTCLIWSFVGRKTAGFFAASVVVELDAADDPWAQTAAAKNKESEVTKKAFFSIVFSLEFDGIANEQRTRGRPSQIQLTALDCSDRSEYHPILATCQASVSYTFVENMSIENSIEQRIKEAM